MSQSTTAGATVNSSTSAASRPWIGADVDKATFAVAIYREPRPGAPDLKALPTSRFARNASGVSAFVRWVDADLARRRPAAPAPRICMEATGNYSLELAAEIISQRPGLAPAIVNARLVKKFRESLGQRCKADKVDARVCAIYGADRLPAPWQPPKYQALQELVRERKALVDQRTVLQNRRGKKGELKLVRTVQEQLRRQLDKHIKKLDQAIAQQLDKSAQLKSDAKQVRQLPGVGPVVTGTVFGELGDLRDYARSRSLSAMVGVNPAVVESGKHQGKTRMSKQGNARVRAVLYCAAMGCLKTKRDHCLKRFHRRLLDHGKTRKQSLGALMRKILLLMRAVLITGEPFDPDYDLRGKNVENRLETVNPAQGLSR
ncbi:IS110 family transposase [Candidatus Sumerlaeota bacterium]